MKLSDSDVLEMCRLRLAGHSLNELAARFGVVKNCVQFVVKGKNRAGALKGHHVKIACIKAERDKLKVNRKTRAAMRLKTARAVNLYVKEWLTLEAAARKCGISAQSLWKELVRRKIARRPVGRPKKPGFYPR